MYIGPTVASKNHEERSASSAHYTAFKGMPFTPFTRMKRCVTLSSGTASFSSPCSSSLSQSDNAASWPSVPRLTFASVARYPERSCARDARKAKAGRAHASGEASRATYAIVSRRISMACSRVGQITHPTCALFVDSVVPTSSDPAHENVALNNRKVRQDVPQHCMQVARRPPT